MDVDVDVAVGVGVGGCAPSGTWSILFNSSTAIRRTRAFWVGGRGGGGGGGGGGRLLYRGYPG